MQAQCLRADQTQECLTAQQSLQSVQTLLRAGLGCITYLRNLLPADNFSQSYLTSAGTEPPASGGSFGGSFASDNSKANVSGFKIMTVTRGYTEEADKLLDYLEQGIFDALQKQYLRSFIFAIYLDNEDPNNIVEAYTFNFKYYRIPGTNVTVPVVSLGDDLMKLSISGKQRKRDPVSDATKGGRVPTLGEVKRSLKTLIKNLIQATTQMDALPRRRYATFKLYYHDHTPDDYEPPYFRAGDSKKDRWFFSTHDATEAPEKCSIGQVETGWHTVDVRVASVSAYLPSVEDNNAPFLGTTTDGRDTGAPTLTPTEEAALRLQQLEIQRQDAAERRVVWDAQEGLGDADAEGEDDDGEAAAAVWRVGAAGLEFAGPIGVRDENGNISPLENAQADMKDPSPSAEAVFAGVEERIPRHVGQLQLPVTNSGEITQTQKAEQTQILPSSAQASPPPSSSRPSSAAPSTPRARRENARKSHSIVPDSLPPSDPGSLASGTGRTGTIDTQVLKDRLAGRRPIAIEDAEMLDMETQMPPSLEDSIDSFAPRHVQSRSGSLTVSQMGCPADDKQPDDVVQCECGVEAEDCDCIMCETCSRWFHVWCMGFHSLTSKKLKNRFTCFDCRVHADQNWDLIMVHGLHPRMMEKYRDLALFRRAIKLCATHNPENLAAFTKLLGCEPLVSGQLFKRLETEGFIVLEQGFFSEQAPTQKGKTTTRSTRRKVTTKPKYNFVQAVKKRKIYNDYFDPGSEAEKRLLGLSDLNPKKNQRKSGNEEDVNMDPVQGVRVHSQGESDPSERGGSQTQPETQLVPDLQEEGTPFLKRKPTSLTNEEARLPKKVKVSVGPAVDLGD